MTKQIALLAAALAFSGCIGGAVDGDTAPPGDTHASAHGIVCTTELSVTGTLAEAAPQPADIHGCWPVGTWKIKPEVAHSGCQQMPALAPEYSFKVMRDLEDNETYAYLNDPGYEHVRVKVTSGGGGLCEGGLTIYSADGKSMLNLKPQLHPGGSMDGHGAFEIYTTDQR